MNLSEAYITYNTGVQSMDSKLAEAIDRILDDKNKQLENLDQIELSEAKVRMALEESNERIEQLEEILHTIHDFAGEYAPFNTAMEKVQKMAKEGVDES